MHFHRSSAQLTCLNGLKVLLIVLITYTSFVQSSVPTEDEINEALSNVPKKYCGKKLTQAIKINCTPFIRSVVLNKQVVKKSVDSAPELDFDAFDLDRIAAESYDDEVSGSRFKIDDAHYSNDIPFMFPSQGNRGRRRRGIVDECCRRACYISELIRYCPQKG